MGTSTRDIRMAMAGTPDQSKSKVSDLPGLDDSGYDGSGSASKGKNTGTETFNDKGVKRLLEICSRTKQDQFWISMTDFLIVVVVGQRGLHSLDGRKRHKL